MLMVGVFVTARAISAKCSVSLVFVGVWRGGREGWVSRLCAVVWWEGGHEGEQCPKYVH